jgi:hypothetical protein
MMASVLLLPGMLALGRLRGNGTDRPPPGIRG